MTRIKLPITSSQLVLNTSLDKGWKTNQSIFEFVKNQIGNSGFSDLLKGLGGKSFLNSFAEIVNGATAVTENLMHIFGRDIQLGPYWSLADGAFDDRQSVTFNTILVNDSSGHAKANKNVLRELFQNSLPRTDGDFKLKPPKLFNVTIDTKVSGRRKYYLCTGNFKCEAKGRYYDNEYKTPEAYSLTLTFNSLVPTFKNLVTNDNDYDYTNRWY